MIRLVEELQMKYRSEDLMDHSAYEAQRYIPALDGLRGVAIALVITYHLHEQIWGFLSGYVGVTIFFVLSGYLITRLAIKEEERHGRLNFGAFCIRRAFRIFPVYYLVLAIYVFLILGLRVSPLKIATFRAALLYDLTYFQELPAWGLVRIPGHELPFYQTWSLGIEEKFYLVWPVLMIVVAASRLTLRLAIVSFAAFLFVIEGIVSEGKQFYHLESYGFILFGVALALLLSSRSTYSGCVSIVRRFTPIAILLALVSQFYLMPHTHLRGVTSMYAVAVAVLVGYIVTARTLLGRLLSFPALVLVGRVSYGIYLIHILCLNVVEHFARPGRGVLTGLVAYVATLLISTGTAYLSYTSFEQPLINLGRRLSSACKREHHPSTIATSKDGGPQILPEGPALQATQDRPPAF